MNKGIIIELIVFSSFYVYILLLLYLHERKNKH
jgi:hypothetical protein